MKRPLLSVPMAIIVLGHYLDGVLADRKVVVRGVLDQPFPTLVGEVVNLVAVQIQLYAALADVAVVIGDLSLDEGGSVFGMRTWIGVYGLYIQTVTGGRGDGGCSSRSLWHCPLLRRSHPRHGDQYRTSPNHRLTFLLFSSDMHLLLFA